ncbi:hypothetical protein [Glutamicibacter sp. NPDC127525]|uniref:hypothetical protein n=1 Tax=unclassified Glutamicibacter TaxID=2627139 RepID=UPI00362BD6FC
MTIQEILEAHLRVMGQRGTGVLCICGWHTVALGKRSEDLHRAHVAEVLDKHMQEREAAVIAGLAELLDEYQNSHDVAECAAHVEGETGRQAVIDNWESIIEEPAEWLRQKSKEHHENGFEHLRYVAYEAWQAGEDAGWENGRNSYEKEQGFIEDFDLIENPYADEDPHNGR